MTAATAQQDRRRPFEAAMDGWLSDRPQAGAPWLLKRRQDALTALEAEGLPHSKVEAWRFTNLRDLLNLELAPTDVSHVASDLHWTDELLPDPAEARRIVLAAGVPVEDSLSTLPDGVTAVSLQKALTQDPTLLEGTLGALATTVGHPFTALNTSLFQDGLLLRIADGAVVEGALNVVHVAGPGIAHPRVVVLAGANSQLSLIESFIGHDEEDYLTNAVTEVRLGAGAHVQHIRVQEEGHEGFHIGRLAVHQDRDSVYTSRVLSLGAVLTRVDVDVVLDGAGAECNLDGLYLTGGQQHMDHHTVIDHVSPRATSHEDYKGILSGKSSAVFDGTIFVRRDAQKSNGAQENRNLLLSDDAVVHTKPHLHIDADDVKCSHGATVGQLDPDQLYYLRARGFDPQTARAALIYAFAREIVDLVPLESLRDHLGSAVLGRLPSGITVKELVS